MSIVQIRDEGQTLSIPTGKILGVVDSQAQLDGVVNALQKAGFDQLQTLHGEEGIHLLERVHAFFWGDCEEAVLHRHIRELKDWTLCAGDCNAPRSRTGSRRIGLSAWGALSGPLRPVDRHLAEEVKQQRYDLNRAPFLHSTTFYAYGGTIAMDKDT